MKVTLTNRDLLPESTRNAFDAVTAVLQPQGEWIDIPYDATRFYGNGAMTWTVLRHNQQTFVYTIIGATAIVMLDIAATSVGGTPNTNLIIRLPSVLTSKRRMLGPIGYIDNGSRGTGTWILLPNSSEVNLNVQLLGGAWSASTSNTYIHGQVIFEIVR